jgi:hypothetical protein
MKHFIPALPATSQSPAALRRPRLLVHAARSLLRAQQAPIQKQSLARLVAVEAGMEKARIQQDVTYRAEAHIRALAALIVAIKAANTSD